jgi:hypothetical protein
MPFPQIIQKLFAEIGVLDAISADYPKIIRGNMVFLP